MAKEDTPQGLLSKMVSFVRNPATSWSELDSGQTNPDEAVSRLHLKEMIERKRRNDFVRKREFDMLRKIRKQETVVGQDPGVRPSFFQSSTSFNRDDRAKTLKKIDEIEAQMSMQWWKTKPADAISIQPTYDAVDSSLDFQLLPAQPPGARINRNHLSEGAVQTTQSGLLARYEAPNPSKAHPSPVREAFRLIQQPASVPIAVLRPAAQAVQDVKPLAEGVVARGNYGGELSGFMQTNMKALDVVEIAQDPELEEASIRYANSDDAGAEAGLLEMLAADSMRGGHAAMWMVLFDLYRATGQQEKFESAALKFVQRFDRSAPQWFSLPDVVKKMLPPVAATSHQGPAVDWICPPTVSIQTVLALKVALSNSPMPWRLDWRSLETIEPSALMALCGVFVGWSAQPVRLQFVGNAQLRQVLEKNTPSGDRRTLRDWWQLRMETLRVVHRPDQFELAALDFCVTYEVSPPAWEAVRCDFQSIDSEGSPTSTNTIVGDVVRNSIVSGLSLTDSNSDVGALNSQASSLMSFELSGQIEGDATAILNALQIKLVGADHMVISCANLTRVDFSAAGTLLNWVAARQDEGCSVQFRDVNRLVAVFFSVIGITEHAKVTSRRD